MRKLKLSKRKQLIFGALAILLVSGLINHFVINAKYNDPNFRSYLKSRQYCDQFWGGTHETKQQLYEDWNRSNGRIDC
jgi:hypothetical protein